MRTTVVMVTYLTIILLGVAVGNAAEIPREPLDQLWEEHMLTGTPAYYFDGNRGEDSHNRESMERARGAILAPIRSIEVNDFRGTALLGLLRGGGWSLMGGLLGKVVVNTSALELYGKWVLHYYPGFLGITHYSKFKEEQTYEFFLLNRERGASRATVLKKWVVQADEIRRFVPGRENEADIPEHIKQQSETEDVRGFLKYFPERQEAEVTISGLTHPLVERIKVELK